MTCTTPEALPSWAKQWPFFRDDGWAIWIPQAARPTRGQAKAAAAAEIGCDFTEIVSCRKVHMQGVTDHPEWSAQECPAETEGAIPFWRCEYRDLWAMRRAADSERLAQTLAEVYAEEDE